MLGYDRSINEHLRFKVESYYQHLYQVPVGTEPGSTYSILNSEGGFPEEELINEGEGRNCGLELSLEQFTYRGMYFLWSTSLYDSRYKTANGNWHDTRFNGNYSTTFTGGKEIRTGEKFKNRIIGLNVKTIYAGGLRQTPIDKAASVNAGETIYLEDQPYAEKQPDYFRTDIKISLSRNKSKSTVTWSLDIQNVTNRNNVYGSYFDPLTGIVKTSYQAGLIPILSYKVEF